MDTTTALLFLPSTSSKPYNAFTKIYGLTLLERTCRALERAAVSDIFIQTEEESRVRSILKKSSDWIVNFHFTTSGLIEKKGALFVIAEPMVIEPKVIETMIKTGQETEKIVLTPNQKIVFISTLATVSEEAIPSPLPPTFSSFLQTVKKYQNRIQTFDTAGLICTTIHNASDKKQAERVLIRSLTKPTDGWVSRHLNRPVSTLFSRMLAHTPVTPNQFTIFTGLIGLLTGFFMALGGYWNYLIAGFLFHFTSILDGVDGELARLKFKSSPFGQWLDTLVDNLCYLAALAGIIIGVFRNGTTPAVKVAGISAVVFALLALGSLYLYLVRFNKGGTLLNVEYSFQDGNSTFDKIMQVAAAFGKRDLFALIFLFLGIIGQLPMALGYVAIMAALVFGFSIQAHLKAAKERRQANR